MVVENIQHDQVILTPPAAKAVQELLLKRNLPNHALRVFVSGGGCSGMQYGMALEENIRPEDNVFETEGVKLIVDEVSITYLHGATVDYVDDLMGGGFKIENPNALSACGCGQSFRSKEGAEGESGQSCGSCS
ncbi:MAG: iron-sulfur cluster insertion protein ErpA [Anaerolineales bacterium]|nr:iron-sulfur cluster insertion protein ErpA [Anaerolineales bacterium]